MEVGGRERGDLGKGERDELIDAGEGEAGLDKVRAVG